MRIVPAVDIRGGRSVNLVQGDYARETVFSDDPVAQAVRWRELGAELVHIVDLDGAREGALQVGRQLRAMAAGGVSFEVGGGIRDMNGVSAAVEAGAQRVILGTAALRDRDLIAVAARAYPGRVVVGIDAKGGKVAVEAWREVTDFDAVSFARQCEEAGAIRIIYTDILSDGMMRGPNLDATRAVALAVSIPVTASGGMSSLQDVRNVHALEGDGVDEVIIGRALYLGAFTLPQAIAAGREAS